MFKDMRKPTIELNLEPSSNQDQFDFAIHKPATVAVEEFKNLLLSNLKTNLFTLLNFLTKKFFLNFLYKESFALMFL